MNSKKNSRFETKPLVNIIILTYNQFNFISECLDAVLKSGYPNIRLYLVDNNSRPEDYKNFYEKYKHLKNARFFRMKRNKGFAGGCNYALKKIKSGYIVFLNDDIIVSRNWLTPIISFMEQNPNVGACQPKIRSKRKPEYFEYAGASGGFMDVYGFPFARGRIFFNSEKDKGQYESEMDLVWCSGACLITKYEIIKKIGIFDEIFFIYGEESDLCWRMNFYGYRLVCIPKSVVYHYGSGTMEKFQYKKAYLHHRNGLILLLKNYTNFELLKYFPVRIFFDYVAFLYYIFDNKKPMNALAVIMSHLNILYSLPKILEIRKKESDKFKMKNSLKYPLYKRSIVLDHFLHKKKKFSQLRMADFNL